MSSLITEQGKLAYIDGLLVAAADITGDAMSDRNAIGEVIASLIGNVDALPELNAATLTASGLVLTAGGSGQWLFVQGRLADLIPATTLNVATNASGLDRKDIVVVKYASVQDTGVMRVVQQPDGSDTNETIFTNRESVAWEYVEGTPGSGFPATPSGWELFAQIDVPNGASTVTPVIQFLTMRHLVTGTDGFPVDSLNGQTGAVTIVDGTAIHVTTVGGVITINVSATLVNSVNSEVGAITITNGSGIGVATAGNVITITNTNPITSVNGQTGAVTIVDGTGIHVSTSGSVVTITNTQTATTVAGLSGAITVTGFGGTTVSVSGQDIEITSAIGVSSLNSLTGPVNITSSGGTIAITPSGSSIDLEVIPSGSMGGTTTAAAQAGIVNTLLVINMGTQETGFASSSDARFPNIPTLLGGMFWGAPGLVTSGTTMEFHYKLEVTPGSGAQTIGGFIQSSGNNTFAALDGSIFFSHGASSLQLAWSVSIPDDSAVHTLILHFDKTFASGTLAGIVGEFLPASAQGGVDSTKFAQAFGGF